jgi:hypothetical protein
MKHLSRVIVAVATLCLLGLSVRVRAAALVDSVQLVSSSAAAAAAVPAPQTVTIAQAGSYVVALSDLQLPAALSSLNLAIANSTSEAVLLTGAGSKTVTLAAGTYTAQVLAVAAAGAVGGTFSVQVTPVAGGAAVWQYEGTVGPASSAPTSGESAVSAQFTATAAGSYQLSATDLAFPVQLSSLSVAVFVHCGASPGCTPTAIYTSTTGALPPFVVPLTLAAGTYDLFVVAKADPTALQGLYSIQIAGGGTTLYGATQSVGTLPAPVSIPIATGGSITLKLTDLAAPAALSSLKAIVAENGSVLEQASAAGTYSIAATAGTAQLYVVGQPGNGGQGAYEAYFTSGSQVLADIAQPVLASGASGYAFTTALAAAGTYQVSVNDFKSPVAFSSLSTVAAQQGNALVSAQGTSANFTAVAAPLNILVFPTVSSPSANGLFGVTVSAAGSGVVVYQAVQGVGALFSSQNVNVTTAGAYDLDLTDFGFPAAMSNLAVIATSGDTVVTTIFGAGQATVNLMPGPYTLSVLAQVGPSANYGLYGLNLDLAPPAPTVTLTASATSVASGMSAMLTWSATNATSCTASGGWNGTLATSGSQSTGALTQNGSFTITCTGAGGSGTQTVQVAVTAAAAAGGGHSGGGAMTPETLLVGAAVLMWQLRRRRVHPRAA